MDEDRVVITWENGKAKHADICHSREQSKKVAFARMAEIEDSGEIVIYGIIHRNQPNDHQFIAQQWITHEVS